MCESVFPESLPVCMRVSEVVQMGRHGFSFQANQRLFDVLMFNIVTDAVMSDPCHYHQHQLSMQESDICILPLLMVKHNSISACWDVCIHWEIPRCQPRLRHSITVTYIWYISHYTEDTICSCTFLFHPKEIGRKHNPQGQSENCFTIGFPALSFDLLGNHFGHSGW